MCFSEGEEGRKLALILFYISSHLGGTVKRSFASSGGEGSK